MSAVIAPFEEGLKTVLGVAYSFDQEGQWESETVKILGKLKLMTETAQVYRSRWKGKGQANIMVRHADGSYLLVEHEYYPAAWDGKKASANAPVLTAVTVKNEGDVVSINMQSLKHGLKAIICDETKITNPKDVKPVLEKILLSNYETRPNIFELMASMPTLEPDFVI